MSEPGSGGAVSQTASEAEPYNPPLEYRISGLKHFGGASGMTALSPPRPLPRLHATGIIECHVAVRIWEGAMRARGFLLNISGQTV